jgi:hypothetical protein
MRSVSENTERSSIFAVVDVTSYAISAMVVAWLAYINKKQPDSEVAFNPLGALFLFVLFLFVYLLVFYKIGNRRYFGLLCAVLTSAGSSILYVCLSILMSTFWSGVTTLNQNGAVFYLVIFFLLFTVSFVISLITRLISLPILFLFRIIVRDHKFG